MPSSFQSATSLSAVTDRQPHSDQTFGAHVPDGWQQGRGAFGGLTLGLLARAILTAEPDPARRMRALTGDICGPVVPGPVLLTTDVLRRGKNLSNIDARLIQAEGVQARASAVLSTPRHVEIDAHTPPPPAVIDYRSIEPLPMGGGLGPTFTQHYEYWNVGDLPFSGAAEARIDGFVRERGRTDALDAPAVIALLDSFWPSLFTSSTQPHAIATVTFSAELFAEPSELPGDAPLRYRSHMIALRDGFLLEHRELWHHTQLVAMNQQTIAVLK